MNIQEEIQTLKDRLSVLEKHSTRDAPQAPDSPEALKVTLDVRPIKTEDGFRFIIQP